MYQHTFLTPNSTRSASLWTRQDDKAFEQALVMFPEELPDRWHRIADQLGKTVRQVEEHYVALEHDVYEIDSGRVELPNYVEECFGSDWDEPASQISFGSGKSKHSGGDGERKKGTPWTEEEHRKFLLGLKKYGKGDWRSISRNVVITRTPTQVASHAQKYFLRQNSVVKKERKRSSIHDITTVDNNVALAVDQSWDPQPAEPVQPMQMLPSSSHFPSQEGLIPSNHAHNQGQGGSFGYPIFNFPM